MAAKELMIFTPFRSDMQSLLDSLVGNLDLTVDMLPDKSEFSFQFSAQRGKGLDYFLFEYIKNDLDVICEISQWERPSDDIKRKLLACESRITIYYRRTNLVKEALLIIGKWFGEVRKDCVIENGYGCLLTLDAIIDNVSRDSTWSWEKKQFPEVSGVAISEWIDL